LDTALGMGMGMGSGGSGTGLGDFAGMKGAYRGRCLPEERMKRILAGGGIAQVEEVVGKGLDYFKATQHGDGSWGNDTFKSAMTGLALLAYLARCETPLSEEYGETVSRAIAYLVQVGMRNNGHISNAYEHNNAMYPYEHAIGLYALCEALAFAKELELEIPNLEETCRQGLDIVLSKQNETGAWDYGYNVSPVGRGGDTSILVWHMQALKAAEHAGLEDSRMRRVVNKALDYLERAHNPLGTFSYHAGEGGVDPAGRLAGAGVFTFQLWGKENIRPARNALQFIDKEMTKMDYAAPDALPLVWYYNANATFQSGGTTWTKFNNSWRDAIISGQEPNGSWRPEGGIGHPAGFLTSNAAGGGDATHYRTALAVLQLCVYYRFLPGTS